MLEPANPVRAPVNDVLFKHIGPNAKRKTAFRARRTINQNTGIDGRTDGNPLPPPPPLIDYFLFINGPEHAINWLMICPRNKLTDKQSNWYVTNFNSIHATKFVARFNLVDYTIDSFRLCKYNNFDNLWKLYIYISRVFNYLFVFLRREMYMFKKNEKRKVNI